VPVPQDFQDCYDDYQQHGDPEKFLICIDWVENMNYYLGE
jgi:hypothetical protein